MGGGSGYGRREWILEEGVDMEGGSGYGRRGGYGRWEWMWQEGVDMGGITQLKNSSK